MRVLIAPLNWGLGHATRCVPVIRNYLAQGDEVILAADGGPMVLLKSLFPELHCIELPSYAFKYNRGKSQVTAMMCSIPGIIRGIIAEHRWLHQVSKNEHFDLVISDNRFGLWNRKLRTVYITHQLMIKMPSGLKWLEPVAWLIHRFIILRYDECWIPDFEHQPSLSGDLSHRYPLPRNARFTGPLSRFSGLSSQEQPIGTLLLVSGPEPQRQLFEDYLLVNLSSFKKPVVLVRGLPNTGQLPGRKDLSIFNHLPDKELAALITGAEIIICRSGYSTIMDLAALGCLHKAQWIPTPGQTEQEYLAGYHKKTVSD